MRSKFQVDGIKSGTLPPQVQKKLIAEGAELLASRDPYVTEELLRKVYDNRRAHFIQFIKHILGLEKLSPWAETVTKAFDDFIAQHTTLTEMQIRFLQTLRTFVLQTGKIAKQDLIAAAFTQIRPKGGSLPTG